jgi:glutathione S-transferase
MFTLFHHPFCPHSRFIRLALGEHGLDLRLVEERVWERREAGPAMDARRLMPSATGDRIEVRRLMAWFNDKFFEEASGPLVTERIYKRFMNQDDGGGAPAADVIRAARINVRYHLAYIGWLAKTRNFLAGDKLTYADLAAAAHLSAIDYLGDVPWSEDDAAKAWYARVKSRPSFRPLLSEWLAGVPASPTYVDLDF